MDLVQFQARVEDGSAQYLDAVARCAELEARATGRARRQMMFEKAPKKTGAMARGAASAFSKKMGLVTVEMGGTEHKTPWLEYGVRGGRRRNGRIKKGHKAQPWVIPSLKGVEESFAVALAARADKIKDVV